ncbi:hypothetical protein [uncultured Faecalicoccus sp.]|uniref:hypothetical protein n=1 Tax=uncultured Faecalicoccus sp. TaxID=1971760 RepID=UPI0026381B4A|nr:hypothetical protein [uncultured Faecalicoccus sp.]
MLIKLSYIDIGEHKYPMSFSIASGRQMGGFIKLTKNFDKDSMDLPQVAQILTDLLYAMIYSGCAYMNRMHLPAYEEAPVDSNGKFIPLKKEDLEVLIPLEPEALNELTGKIKECINLGKQRDIKAVENKNLKKKKQRR